LSWTSIPTWVKTITICFEAVIGQGTAAFLLRVGSNASVLNTGYISYVQSTGTPTSSTNSTGLQITNTRPATTRWSGAITLTTMGNQVWVSNGLIVTDSPGSGYALSGGSINVGTNLTRIDLITTDGAFFLSGKVSIAYQ
jgi:hypothetical protein